MLYSVAGYNRHSADIYFLSNYYNSYVLDNSSIMFKVKGERVSKMFMLSHKKSFTAPFYNIVIDGWSNVKSATRKGSSYAILATQTPING
jgi:hypothetical protein